MKNLITILCIASVMITACNSNRIYEKHKDLSPNIKWEKSKKVEFEVNIKDVNLNYNILLALRFITGYQYKTLEVNLTRTAPSGEVSSNIYSLKVMGDNMQYNGEGAGDYWDLETLVEKNITFPEAGIYKFVAEHNMPQDPVNNVMELGLIVEKSR